MIFSHLDPATPAPRNTPVRLGILIRKTRHLHPRHSTRRTRKEEVTNER